MPANGSNKPSGAWTADEVARHERAEQWRAAQERAKTPQERLEETVRLSKLMSELRSGLPRDVPA
jgi:hypothetical protein